MSDTMNPLVSVVLCFFNEEQFVEEAIVSVLNQEYKFWQLILVDDGSNDRSSVISKKYVDKLSNKVIYVNHENNCNKGVSASRNYGVNIAAGSLIAFLDADDLWLPGKLQQQVTLMAAYPHVAMICEASEYWYSWNNTEKQDAIVLVGSEQNRVFSPPELLKIVYPLSNNPAPCPSGIMIRKNTVIKHGGFVEHFKGKYQLYEDQAFLHKIYLQEYIYISSFCNNRYRQREGSCVQKVTAEGNYHAVRKYFLVWFEDYLKQNNFKDRAILKILKKALQPYHSHLAYFLGRTRQRFNKSSFLLNLCQISLIYFFG